MKKDFAIRILIGFVLGALGMHLLARDNAGNAFRSGNAEAWRDIVTLMKDRQLIRGPLEVNEPNAVIKNCVFIRLTNSYDTADCHLGVDAVNSLVANNLFLTVDIMRTIKGGEFPYEDFWATDAETFNIEHLHLEVP